MLLDFSSRCYLRDGIQPPRFTQSSSSVTLLRPTAQSHLKITNHYFTQHLSCAINCLRVSCVHHFTMRQVDCKCGHCSPLFPCYVILVLQSTCLMMFNWPTCPVLLQVRPVSNSELTDIVGAECPADTASGQWTVIQGSCYNGSIPWRPQGIPWWPQQWKCEKLTAYF